MKLLRFFFAVTLLCTLPLLAENTYTADQAKNHVGERATVCGVVASAHFASSKGQPTFLNLDNPYPDLIFTVLIWGNDRAKFGTPERDYMGKNIFVTGTIQRYRNSPEIVARDLSQIAVR